jgi:hypothetical protein
VIVISAGLPKSGTGLYFNLTNDLLIRSGKMDARIVRDNYHADILKYYNCNLEQFTYSNIVKLFVTNCRVGSFAIKTHEPPIRHLKALAAAHIAKCTCIYRDPRDVVLSAIDHGEKVRKKGEAHPFTPCTTIEATIPFVKGWLDHSILKWLKVNGVLIVKYENLVLHPLSELKRLAAFLNVDIRDIDLAALYSQYDKNSLQQSNVDRLHFNQGVVNRFRSVLSKDELEMCNHHFRSYLQLLDYPL